MKEQHPPPNEHGGQHSHFFEGQIPSLSVGLDTKIFSMTVGAVDLADADI